MITAGDYEKGMLDLKRQFAEDPVAVKKQMDELNLEALVCMGYSAGAKIYAELNGLSVKEVSVEYHG